jgi:hypothetical protein
MPNLTSLNSVADVKWNSRAIFLIFLTVLVIWIYNLLGIYNLLVVSHLFDKIPICKQ